MPNSNVSKRRDPVAQLYGGGSFGTVAGGIASIVLGVDSAGKI